MLLWCMYLLKSVSALVLCMQWCVRSMGMWRHSMPWLTWRRAVLLLTMLWMSMHTGPVFVVVEQNEPVFMCGPRLRKSPWFAPGLCPTLTPVKLH